MSNVSKIIYRVKALSKRLKLDKIALSFITITILFFIVVQLDKAYINSIVSDNNSRSGTETFLLFNINALVLALFLIYLVRRIIKTLSESRSNLFGSKISTRLVAFTVLISSIPTIAITWVAIVIISTSLDKWFDKNIENSLISSIKLMDQYKNLMLNELDFRTIKIADLVSQNELLNVLNKNELVSTIFKQTDHFPISDIYIYNYKGKLIYHDPDLFNNNVAVIDLSTDLSEILPRVLENKEYKNITRYNNESEIFITASPITTPSNRNIVVGAIFLTRQVDSYETYNYDSIKDSYNNYKSIGSFAPSTKQIYFSIIIFVAIGTLLLAISGGIILAVGMTKPISELIIASEEVTKGNLQYKIKQSKNSSDELTFLTNLFNNMTTQLRYNTEELNKKNEKLVEMYAQVKKDSAYIETIFRSVKAGILLFDTELNILEANQEAKRMTQDFDNFFEILPTLISKFLKLEIDDHNEQLDIKNNNNNIKHFNIRYAKLIDYHSRNNETVIFVFLEDITDVLEAERVNIWKELAQRITHEIKNPLTPIKLVTERVNRKLSKDDSIDPNIKETIIDSMSTINSEVEHMQDIIKEFNMFARMPTPTYDHVDLVKLMQSTIELYNGYSDVKFNLTYNGKDDTNILADQKQLHRIFINLINNSIDAMKEKGIIKINIAEREDSVKIIFEDNGIGIEHENLAKIFMPYFSKKSNGTGLGLAIVSKIIEEHRGTISAESQVGVFTRFTITLPKQGINA